MDTSKEYNKKRKYCNIDNNTCNTITTVTNYSNNNNISNINNIPKPSVSSVSYNDNNNPASTSSSESLLNKHNSKEDCLKYKKLKTYCQSSTSLINTILNDTKDKLLHINSKSSYHPLASVRTSNMSRENSLKLSFLINKKDDCSTCSSYYAMNNEIKNSCSNCEKSNILYKIKPDNIIKNQDYYENDFLNSKKIKKEISKKKDLTNRYSSYSKNGNDSQFIKNSFYSSFHTNYNCTLSESNSIMTKTQLNYNMNMNNKEYYLQQILYGGNNKSLKLNDKGKNYNDDEKKLNIRNKSPQSFIQSFNDYPWDTRYKNSFRSIERIRTNNNCNYDGVNNDILLNSNNNKNKNSTISSKSNSFYSLYNEDNVNLKPMNKNNKINTHSLIYSNNNEDKRIKCNEYKNHTIYDTNLIKNSKIINTNEENDNLDEKNRKGSCLNSLLSNINDNTRQNFNTSNIKIHRYEDPKYYRETSYYNNSYNYSPKKLNEASCSLNLNKKYCNFEYQHNMNSKINIDYDPMTSFTNPIHNNEISNKITSNINIAYPSYLPIKNIYKNVIINNKKNENKLVSSYTYPYINSNSNLYSYKNKNKNSSSLNKLYSSHLIYKTKPLKSSTLSQSYSSLFNHKRLSSKLDYILSSLLDKNYNNTINNNININNDKDNNMQKSIEKSLSQKISYSNVNTLNNNSNNSSKIKSIINSNKNRDKNINKINPFEFILTSKIPYNYSKSSSSSSSSTNSKSSSLISSPYLSSLKSPYLSPLKMMTNPPNQKPRNEMVDLTHSNIYIKCMTKEDGENTGGWVWNSEFLEKYNSENNYLSTTIDNIAIPSASVTIDDIVLTEEDLKLF
ncbi:hypothetical protein H8356DRAFT_1317389 [Neocallimastix lanati (nom. inval.)]|uniref:Uncharacterized protein n=1 Tax=Neocallimastix californiae TaxID=1754190 RepID=A0A1Y2B217_9FUNG|nr:hypothetical protein H8356DRAFT_1317389 [Neocallimastix sp. JGI-2020a]ORY28853.1 hypothetical protein LY90DRAFT_674033 [Neocallimastix californiae]|eukprot:ORY28853.1 hypothetical protein LY90DRAFT_674033 [Neocallimastix californiae]